MFTITNLKDGDISFGGIGTVKRGRTLSIKFITPEIRAAKVAGQITITPAVTTVIAVSGLTNSIASYAVASIVNPADEATARANDATMAAQLIVMRNDLEALRAYVEAWVKPGSY